MHCTGGVCPGGMCLAGGCLPGGGVFPGDCVPASGPGVGGVSQDAMGQTPPSVDRQTPVKT